MVGPRIIPIKAPDKNEAPRPKMPVQSPDRWHVRVGQMSGQSGQVCQDSVVITYHMQ